MFSSGKCGTFLQKSSEKNLDGTREQQTYIKIRNNNEIYSYNQNGIRPISGTDIQKKIARILYSQVIV